MLIVTRRIGEVLRIGIDIRIEVLSHPGRQVKLAHPRAENHRSTPPRNVLSDPTRRRLAPPTESTAPSPWDRYAVRPSRKPSRCTPFWGQVSAESEVRSPGAVAPPGHPRAHSPRQATRVTLTTLARRPIPRRTAPSADPPLALRSIRTLADSGSRSARTARDTQTKHGPPATSDTPADPAALATNRLRGRSATLVCLERPSAFL